MNWFRRTPARDPQVENALRHSLAEHARQAPAGEDVTDRVLAAVDGARRPAPNPYRGPSRWRAWTLPLVAAGSVAAVVGVVAGIQQLDKPSHRNSAVASPSLHISGPHSAPVSGPPTAHVFSSSVPPPRTSTAPADTSTLHNVRILDLTFAGLDDGWALAVADCILRPGERCPALLRTTDGTHWTSSPNTPFNVPGQTGGCRNPCVEHLRFATDDIGYAYGPDTFMMTTNGTRWVTDAVNVLYLETLNQNVIRVISSGTGCPGPCDIRIQTAPIGSDNWTTELGPVSTSGGVQFARGGDDAYLLLTGHVAGGGQDATSTLYRSADNGGSWQQGGEPCPQLSPEDDSYVIAAGAAGRVAILCMHRGPQLSHPVFLATSADHGENFTAQPDRAPSAELLTGDPATVLVDSGGGGLSRSTDGGRSWSRIRYPISRVSFAGFESAQVGRVVAADGTEIWTTRDGGKSWTKVLFN